MGGLNGECWIGRQEAVVAYFMHYLSISAEGQWTTTKTSVTLSCVPDEWSTWPGSHFKSFPINPSPIILPRHWYRTRSTTNHGEIPSAVSEMNGKFSFVDEFSLDERKGIRAAMCSCKGVQLRTFSYSLIWWSMSLAKEFNRKLKWAATCGLHVGAGG